MTNTKTQPPDLLAHVEVLREMRAHNDRMTYDRSVSAAVNEANRKRRDALDAAIDSLAAHRGEVDTGNYVHDPLYKALDALYDRGWTDLEHRRKYDARGTNQWQAVLDLFRAYATHPPQAHRGEVAWPSESKPAVDGDGWVAIARCVEHRMSKDHARVWNGCRAACIAAHDAAHPPQAQAGAGDAARVLLALAEQYDEMAQAARSEDEYERRDVWENAASQARTRANQPDWISAALEAKP